MSLTINTNLNALQAQGNLGRSSNGLATAMQRLSSGLRINSAADDAAGLAISQRMSAQINGVAQAGRNANEGISLAQTADGALASVGDNLQRLRQLAVQSANGSNSASDRAALQQEAAQLVAETDRIASQTQYNGVNLLDGSFASQAFQVGANAGQTLSANALPSVSSTMLGRFYGISSSVGPVVPGAGADTLYVQLQSGARYVFGVVQDDAAAVAAAFNSGLMPGLSASAVVNTVAGAASQTNTGSASGVGVLTLNGVNINLTYTSGAASGAQNRAAAVAAINAQTSSTGVVASDNGTGVDLTAADGRNIITGYASGSATASVMSDFGLGAAGSKGSSVNFSFHDPLAVAANQLTIRGAALGGIGVTHVWSYTFSGSTINGTPLSNVDLSTVAGANAAIAAADEALGTVNSARANLGALQNRFQSELSGLQSSATNLNASRSRIQDADFAQETAALARSQILQQAGTAMVAQANQQPQGVLALLK